MILRLGLPYMECEKWYHHIQYHHIQWYHVDIRIEVESLFLPSSYEQPISINWSRSKPRLDWATWPNPISFSEQLIFKIWSIHFPKSNHQITSELGRTFKLATVLAWTTLARFAATLPRLLCCCREALPLIASKTRPARRNQEGNSILCIVAPLAEATKWLTIKGS